MTTPLFKEALIETKKLRAIATEEAKQAVLESLSPIIKQMLDKEIAGTGTLFEEVTDEPLPTPEVTPAPSDALVPPTDATVTPPVDAAPPETPAPITPTDGMDIPMPGPDGKITVDIEQLFHATPDDAEPVVSADTTEPPPEEPVVPTDTLVPPTPETAPPAAIVPDTTPATPLSEKLTHAVLTKEIGILEDKIQQSRNAGTLRTPRIYESAKETLFSLFEQVEELKHNGTLNGLVASLEEGRLEMLYSSLLETAKEANSYKGQPQKEANMKTTGLKAFASALFEEAPTPKGKTGFGDGDAAPAVSKTDKVDDGSARSTDTAPQKNSKSTPVEDPGKADSQKHGSAAGFSESVDEAEMLKMENELKEMFGLDETPEEEESVVEGAPVAEETPVTKESKKAALAERLRSLKEEAGKLQKELAECGMSETPVNVNITVDTGGDEAEVHGAGDLDLGGDVASVTPADHELPAGDELGDDDEIELVDDEDEEREEEEEGAMPTSGGMPSGLAESKVMAENKALRQQLEETQLLMARSLYVNKLFAGKNLSGDQKRKIVEYLDSARTIQEAKSTYGRIKNILDKSDGQVNENTKKPVKSGSGSAPTRSGGAQQLDESANPVGQWSFDTNRWARLAGITK